MTKPSLVDRGHQYQELVSGRLRGLEKWLRLSGEGFHRPVSKKPLHGIEIDQKKE